MSVIFSLASRSSRTRSSPLERPTPTADRDQTVSRRLKLSSHTTLNGEQPYPWDRLQSQDVMSRHRGAKTPLGEFLLVSQTNQPPTRQGLPVAENVPRALIRDCSVQPHPDVPAVPRFALVGEPTRARTVTAYVCRNSGTKLPRSIAVPCVIGYEISKRCSRLIWENPT